jgi:hypothetical protein
MTDLGIYLCIVNLVLLDGLLDLRMRINMLHTAHCLCTTFDQPHAACAPAQSPRNAKRTFSFSAFSSFSAFLEALTSCLEVNLQRCPGVKRCTDTSPFQPLAGAVQPMSEECTVAPDLPPGAVGRLSALIRQLDALTAHRRLKICSCRRLSPMMGVAAACCSAT